MLSQKIKTLFSALREKLEGKMNRYFRKFLRISWKLAGPAALTLLFSLFSATMASAQRPNIILIIADDMGYGDVGFNGQTRIKTPSMDALAAQGMVLTRHYCGAPSCSPSRASLMTGMHVGHCKVNNNGMEPLRPEDRTLAELLRALGYGTHFIGKWGLGGSTYYPVVELILGGSQWRGDGSLIPSHMFGLPTTKGFSTSYAYLCQLSAHYYFPEFLHRGIYREPFAGNQAPVYTQRTNYSQDAMLNEALNIIANATIYTPFFLNYSCITPHRETKFPRDPYPASIPPAGPNAYYPYVESDWDGMNPPPLPVDKAYAAMITYMDQQIGEIVNAVNANPAIRDNTLIIVTSDNGPQQTDGHLYTMFNSSGGLRNNKFHLHEGGIRVPFVAVWPNKIPAGTRRDHPCYFADYLATFADIVGTPVPRGTDGISFLPTLLDLPGQEKHDYMVWTQYGRTDRPVEAIQKKQTPDGKIWKLLRWQDGFTVELYDLVADPAETTNLAASYPSIVSEMINALEANTTGPKTVYPAKIVVEGDTVSLTSQNAPIPCSRPTVTENTVAYWRFDNDGPSSGQPATTIKDEVQLHNGTASAGPLYTDNVPATHLPQPQSHNLLALSLNGINQNVIIPHHNNLDLSSGSFTLEAWVRITDHSKTYPLWVFYKKPMMTTDLFIEYSFLANLKTWISQPRIYGKTQNLTGKEIGMVFGDGTAYWVLASNFEITDTEWHYISVAIDHTNFTARFVLDQNYETIYFDGNNTRLSGNGNLVLGGHHNVSGTYNHFFPGVIDELRITRGVVPPHRLLSYPPRIEPIKYELVLGAIPLGTRMTRYFRLGNNPTQTPADYLVGEVSADCITDPRVTVQTGIFGPIIDGSTSQDFGVVVDATSMGEITEQYIDVTAFSYALGNRAVNTPLIIILKGAVVEPPHLDVFGDVTPATTFNPNPRPDTTVDTVAYWRFDSDGKNPGEPAGTILDLASIHVGAASGVPLYSDQVGTPIIPLSQKENAVSLQLNGINQFITISSDQALALPEDFTMEAWIKLDSLANDPNNGNERQWILFRKKDYSYDMYDLEYGFMAQMASWTKHVSRRYGNTVNPSGREIGLVFTTGTDLWSVISNFEIKDHNWHYISAAFDSINRQVRFVLDDRWEIITVGNDNRVVSDGTLYIGCHRNINGTFNQFLHGAIDEIRLSKRFLPLEDLLFYPPNREYPRIYEMDFGQLTYDTSPGLRNFTIRNYPPTNPAGAMYGFVSSANVTDSRITAPTGFWGPLVPEESVTFEVVLTPSTVGTLENEYLDITAFEEESGYRVSQTPVIIKLLGQVIKAEQTITFNPLSSAIYGTSPFALTATASSGLPVSYSSSNPSVATVSGNMVTLHGVGTTTITALQPGNENYLPAIPVQRGLTVDPASLIVTIVNTPTRYYDTGNTSITLNPTHFEVLGLAPGEYVTITQTLGTFDSDAIGPRVVTAILSVEHFDAQPGTNLSNYTLPSSATGPGLITDKLIPEIVQWPSASNLTYGQSLGQSVLSGGSANVPGTFAFTNPTVTPNAGIYSASVTFTPQDTVTYTSVMGSILVTVEKAPASVLLGNLDHVYDGTAKLATITTNPQGLAVTITYNGSPVPPVNAGAYTVNVVIIHSNYQGTGTGVLTINQATASITLSGLNHIYDGTPKIAAVLTNPPGLTVSLTYNGTTTPPVRADSYIVAATITDANYQGSTSGILVIHKATPLINTPPTASTLVLGQSLSAASLQGGLASVPGIFVFTLPQEIPGLGTSNQSVTFIPSDEENYNRIFLDIPVTVVPAQLTVNLLTPSYIEAHVGDTVVLEVEILYAEGIPSIVWLKNGRPLQDQNTPILELQSVTPEDSGTYRCEVTDSSKATVSSPEITVVVVEGLPLYSDLFAILIIVVLCLAGLVMFRFNAQHT